MLKPSVVHPTHKNANIAVAASGGRHKPFHHKQSSAVGAPGDSLRVQTLRGLACALLVGFHVIGSESLAGMRVADDSLYRAFANLFTPLRMPLFTFLSGFVYAYRPVTPGQTGVFASKKLMRLWLPFLTVSALYYMATFAAPDVTGRIPLAEAWKIYVFSYVHFWFLQAIILIFAATIVLERVGALARFGRFALTLAGMLAASLYADPNRATLFSYQSAIYLAPFFFLGLGANRFRDILRKPLVLWACGAMFTITMTLHALNVATVPGVAQSGSPLAVAIGATGALTLLWGVPHMQALTRLGTYSFGIYLYHPFFVALSRKLLHVVHLASPEVLFATGLFVGLLGPPVFEMVVRRIPIAKTYLLGQN